MYMYVCIMHMYVIIVHLCMRVCMYMYACICIMYRMTGCGLFVIAII